MKNYEIKKTTMGPAVIYENEILFLDQTISFFDIIEENPEFLWDITDAVIAHYDEQVALFRSALTDRHTASAASIHTTVAIINNYWELIFDKYPSYSQSVLKAQGEDAVWDMSDPKKALIHQFYTKADLHDNQS
jgi:hypothetical protein